MGEREIRREQFISRLIHEMAVSSSAEAFTLNMINKCIAAYDKAMTTPPAPQRKE